MASHCDSDRTPHRPAGYFSMLVATIWVVRWRSDGGPLLLFGGWRGAWSVVASSDAIIVVKVRRFMSEEEHDTQETMVVEQTRQMKIVRRNL